MNKATLVAQISEKAGLTRKQAAEALEAFVSTVTDELAKGEKVQVVGFGTFEVKARAAHTGRNPATGETIKIKAKKVAKFTLVKAVKDAVL